MKTAMPIRPVRTREQHCAAVSRIEALMNVVRSGPEDDELDILATLVDAYEAKHDPIDRPNALSVIEFCMDQQQLSRKDLEPMIGSRGRVSDVLTGKRALTLPMIRRLASGLRVPADLLIGQTGPVRRVRRSNRDQATGHTKLQSVASS